MQPQAAGAGGTCAMIRASISLPLPSLPLYPTPCSSPSRLHYTSREPFLADLAALAAWRAERGPSSQPQFVWADVPLQHFATPDGRFKKMLMEQVGRLAVP